MIVSWKTYDWSGVVAVLGLILLATGGAAFKGGLSSVKTGVFSMPGLLFDVILVAGILVLGASLAMYLKSGKNESVAQE